MYIENTNDVSALFEELLDELANLARTKMDNNGKGCVGFTINPVDDSRELVLAKKPCACKSNSLKFRNIVDDIDNVIFNDPATIVTFKDGTKVCVKACEKDKFCKETGLIYAIIKRLYANDVDENGYLKSKGLGEKINKVINNAYDQKKAEAERRAERKAKKAAKEAAQKEADAKANLANEVSEKAAQEAVNQVYNQTPNEQK